mgnify:CR=1 FL=1
MNRRRFPVKNSMGKIFESVLITQDEQTHKLAILLPGAGYHIRMPIFYYLTSLFLEKGYDVLHINYNFSGDEYEKLSNAAFFQCVKKDVLAAFEKVVPGSLYQEFTVAGKSLGTLAMTGLFTEKKEMENARAIWLTPLLHNEAVFEHMIDTGRKSLAVMGTDDFGFREERWTQIKQKPNFDTWLIDQADHSLDIKSDALSSIEALKTAIEHMKQFI